jgi:hypothetical protein
MSVNKTKLVAAGFIIASSILLISNDQTFTPLVLILNVIGIVIFSYSIVKQKK